MSAIGTIKEIWRYPVSSIGGELIEEAKVSGGGVEGDRQFALVDGATREVASPENEQRWRKAIFLKARTTARGVEVLVPGEDWLAQGSGELRKALTAFLGFDADILPHAAAPRRYSVAPLHVLTTSSLARLKSLYPAGQMDVRRFRMNVLVEMADRGSGFPEAEWIGKGMRLGKVKAQITAPAKRCAFTTLAQEGLDDDPEILRTIVRHGGRNLGVYVTPEAGRIKVGDEVMVPAAGFEPATP